MPRAASAGHHPQLARQVEILERQRRQPAHHQQRDGGDDGAVEDRIGQQRTGFGALELEAQQHGQKDHAGRGRCRHAGEMLVGLVLVLGFHGLDVETGQTNGAAGAIDKRHGPAGAARLMQRPQIDEHGRRDAEADEIGEAVELGAELAVRAEQARHLAVHRVEHGGDDDGDHGRLPVSHQREADRRGAGAQGKQRQPAGQEAPEGEAIMMIVTDLGDRAPGPEPSHNCHPNPESGMSATTVSPATMVWPGRATTRAPSGR